MNLFSRMFFPEKKFFIITFLGSILWIAAFSYLMVWWATVAGEAIGIPPPVSTSGISVVHIFIINDGGATTKNCAIYGNIVFCKIAFPKLFIRFFSRGVNFCTLLLFLEHFVVVVLVLLVMHKKIERASIMGKWLVHTRTLKSFNFQIEFMFLLPPQIIIKRKTFIRIHHHIYTLTRHTSNTIYLLSVIETIFS